MPASKAMPASKPLLVVRHVPWEGPHRILDAFEGVPVRQLDILEDWRALPHVAELCGAVLMGGPMSANDTDRLPRLAEELAWLGRALEAALPILGVCLGSQLLAHALGAEVRAGPAWELGFAPIEVLERGDPLMRPLATAPTVLHWHAEAFGLPPGALALARSATTAVQAFRYSDHAWGLLFHAEADARLVERWLAQPAMAAEARAHLGSAYAERLKAGAAAVDVRPGAGAFAAFARRCGVG